MLRTLVISIGVALILATAWMTLISHTPWQASIQLAIFGVLILVGTFLEGRYRSNRSGGASWQPTGERFVDPSTGALTEVTYNPQTGERSYQTPANAQQFPKV
jgi:hypothetical protein